MQGAYLGPEFTRNEIYHYLERIGAHYQLLTDTELFYQVAELLAQENVIGWFQGPMEYGPRALGNRSIIGDPRSAKMQSIINLKIKYRESFRPFAPAILKERVTDYFEIDRPSPYMLLVASLQKEQRIPLSPEQEQLSGIKKLKAIRSTLPAITHVDYSARIQTVDATTNPRFHNLLSSFEQKTGCPVLVNTSFNVRGEPIVCSPEDAYRCFMHTEMDYLVLDNYILAKSEQTSWEKDNSLQTTFELD